MLLICNWFEFVFYYANYTSLKCFLNISKLVSVDILQCPGSRGSAHLAHLYSRLKFFAVWSALWQRAHIIGLFLMSLSHSVIWLNRYTIWVRKLKSLFGDLWTKKKGSFFVVIDWIYDVQIWWNGHCLVCGFVVRKGFHPGRSLSLHSVPSREFFLENIRYKNKVCE